jgi:hypothetical protein
LKAITNLNSKKKKKKEKKKEKSIALDLSSKEFGLWAWKDDKRYKTEEHCPGHF